MMSLSTKNLEDALSYRAGDLWSPGIPYSSCQFYRGYPQASPSRPIDQYPLRSQPQLPWLYRCDPLVLLGVIAVGVFSVIGVFTVVL